MIILILSLVIVFHLLVSLIYFSRKDKTYSAVRQTISELGAKGSPNQKQVNYYVFLPVGILLLVVAIITSRGLLHGIALSCGVGYLVAAFFPLDKPQTSVRSPDRWLHLAGGVFQYVGSAGYLSWSGLVIGFVNAQLFASVVIALFIGMVYIRSFRGLIQRLAETFLFGMLLWLAFRNYLLS